MTADFELELRMSGSEADIISMLKAIGKYRNIGIEPAFLTGIKVNEKEFDFGSIKYEDGSEVNTSDEVRVTASGLYGQYQWLIDVDIFRDMAEAAPKAFFQATISGFTTYTEQSLECVLEDSKLITETYFEENNELAEAWVEHFCKILPVDQFMSMFMVTLEKADENEFSFQDNYNSFISEITEVLSDEVEYAEFDDFVSILEDYGGKTELEEERYTEIVEEELPDLDPIIGFPEFLRDDGVVGEREKYIYDPIAKKFIGKRPWQSVLEKTDTNELIARGLEKLGRTNDKESTGNLSIEDAYAALYAALDEEDE